MDITIEQQSIAFATRSSQKAFARCLLFPRLMHYEWAENRSADFNLWIAGTGALSEERASLDRRLAYEPDVVAVIKGLLLLLQNSLSQCVAIAGGNDL
jgi:hypothetical protein